MLEDKMADYETTCSDIERSQIILKSKTFNRFNKKKRKKHKLNEADIMPEASIIESNNTLNNFVSNENKSKCIFEYSNEKYNYKSSKKHTKSEKENSHKKKNKYKFINPSDVTDCEITEVATFESEKADDNVNSSKFRKRKKKVIDAENLSDCKNLEIAIQDLENNSCIETLKETNKCEKKKRHKSLDKMECVSNNRIKESEETENNKILNELYKRKRSHKHKQIENNKMLDCININLYDFETSQRSLSSEISDDICKQKRKKRKKLDAAENLPTINEFKSNHISNNIMDYEDQEEENYCNQNVLKLKIKKNIYPETKPHNYRKKKYKYIDDTNTFDCKITEAGTIDKLHEYTSLNKFHKKKKKRKVTDAENVYEIPKTDKQDSEDDSNVKFSNALRKQKKKDKHKLLSELEDDFSYQNSTVDEEKNSAQSLLEVLEKKDKHKQAKVDKKFHSKTADLNIEENQDNLNSETFYEFHKKKKKKHKHKLCFEVENNIQESAIEDSEIAKICDTLDVCREDKKADAEKISDYKIINSDIIEINQDYLNNENNFIFHKNKKKKHKQKLLNEMENIYNSKTPDSVDQNDLNGETLNSFHKTKKKKHKHNLFDKMENIYDLNVQKSAMTEQEKNIILDVPDMQSKNKKVQVNKMPGDTCLTSNTVEINQNDLNSEIFAGLHKYKRKKHRHKLIEENITKTVTESNNTSNDICQDHIKEKNIVQNSDDDRHPRTKRNKKKRLQSRSKIILNDLHEKKKNVGSEGHEKNCQEDVYLSFDPFVYDMNEVPVPFPVPLLHEGETAGTIPPNKRAELEKNGITIHNGKWTKAEDDILARNFQQFGLEFKVNNPFQLLGINQNRKNEKLVKFLRAKHFWLRLGKDLNNRTLRSIYMRARKLFNPLNKGKLSAQETIDLKHAYELVGNKWTRISDMLSRSDNNCLTAYRWCRKDINKGKWTAEEETTLIKAIKSVTNSEDISANNGKTISWKAVAVHVPTRNEFQCHKYWAEHLAWDSSVSEKKKWEKCHYGKLIYFIKDKYSFNSEYEIDWRELHKHFKHVAPSYIFLRKKWLYLKGRIPKKLGLSFSEYLNVLTKLYVEQYKMFANTKC